MIRKLKALWRAWDVFLNCCPAEEPLGPEWEERDRAELRKFLATGEGQRLQGLLRRHLRQLEAQACAKPGCADFERGRANGVRVALTFIQTLSETSTPQPKEEPEFVLPDARHRLESFLAP